MTVGDSLPQEFLIGKFHLVFFPYMELPAESVTTVTLPIYRSIQKVIGAQHKPTNYTAFARSMPRKALVLQRRVEIGRGAGILAALRAILTVCRIKRPRLFIQFLPDIAAIRQEMSQPVVFPAICLDGFLHTYRQVDFEFGIDHAHSTLDHPFQNRAPRIGEQVIGIVLDVAFALDLGGKGITIRRRHVPSSIAPTRGRWLVYSISV